MIQHISYYKDNKRIIVKPDAKGKFSLLVGVGQYSKPKFESLTATEFINHSMVKDYDPTITLTDGNKLRVYHAGNSNIPIVHPSLVAEQFDVKFRQKRKNNLQKKLDTLKKKKDGEKRDDRTTQPMAPIAPPYPGSRKSPPLVSNGPPQKKDSSDDPFGPLIDAWFGTDDDKDDPNDGLYDDDYRYGYDDDEPW